MNQQERASEEAGGTMNVHLVAFTLAAQVVAAPAVAQTPIANTTGTGVVQSTLTATALPDVLGSLVRPAPQAIVTASADDQQAAPPGEQAGPPETGRPAEGGARWNVWNLGPVTAGMVLTFGADIGGFVQDAENTEQVGNQPTLVKWRAERINFGGTINFKTPWVWQVGGNFNGLEAEAGNRWTWLDVRLDVPIPKVGRIRIGRQKVGASHEWVMALADSVYMERATSSLFYPQRNLGVIVTNTHAKDRVMWSVGAFNDWYAQGNSFAGNGNQYAARISVLPMDPGPNRDGTMVQVGASVFYREATNGKLQYRSRPEINQSDDFIDTGKFDADHSLTTQFEAMLLKGRTGFFGEWAMTPTTAPKVGDPFFWGGFVGASYFLTKDTRPVNRREGIYQGRTTPHAPVGSNGGWGAWEIGGRYSYTDLASAAIDGGRISRWTAVLNWYMTYEWLFRIDYGYTTLNQHGTVGHAHGISARVGWSM